MLALTVLMTQIVMNKPNINRDKAFEITTAISEHSETYGIPGNIMAAIARVESSYNVGAVNERSSDYGLFQINEFNIKAYKLDRRKLLIDTNYSTEAGFKVFSWFYKTYPLEEAIMRYNCGTRKACINLPSVINYLKKVKKYL